MDQAEEKPLRFLFADVLEEAGIDHVFGMPGGCRPFLFDALFEKKGRIHTVLVRHEGGAAIMADLYARLAGKPAVVMSQGPWIGTSGGIGIIEALHSGLPMLIIADTSDYFSIPLHGPYQNSTGNYGSTDLPNMMRGMTKYTTVVSNASEFLHGLKIAIKHATTGRPGPAAVLIKWNAAFQRAPWPSSASRRIPKICVMAGSEARPCVRGSLFHREVEAVLDLVGSGQLSRSELEAALTADELKLVDEAGVATSQWYDIATVDKMMTLAASKSGLTLPEFCRMRGAKAAEALWKSGLYQQLEYLDRMQVSKTSDPDLWVREFGHDLRLLVSLSKNMFNFTQWSVREEPDSPRRFQIEISQASDFSDLAANCTDGFVNWPALKREQSRMWDWSRPFPDVVLFRMLRDA